MVEDPEFARVRDAIEAAGGLVTPREIAAEWEMSEQAVAQRIAEGKFPEPVKVAGRVRLYLRDEVLAYRHGNRHLARRDHPTFWDWLASDAGQASNPPVELSELLQRPTVPLGARRLLAVRNYLESIAMPADDVVGVAAAPS